MVSDKWAGVAIEDEEDRSTLYYRAEEGLDDGGARGVGDAHALELRPEPRVVGGVAAAHAALTAAESQRLSKHHQLPCGGQANTFF